MHIFLSNMSKIFKENLRKLRPSLVIHIVKLDGQYE